MENVPTNWCKSWQNCNFGLIWAFSGPLGSPALHKFLFFLTESFKLWPILKVCTVLKNFLAKTPKIIPRNNEKWHFGPILDHFRDHCSAQSNLKKKKKSFEGTLMAITILFGGNLWKMSQQICVNLVKTAILG